MAKATTGLTAAQLAIMGLFWDEGELGVAQVWQLLGKRRRVARNTVQTTLARLAEKGWLLVHRDGNTDYFRAARPRNAVVRGIIGQLVDTVFAGSTSGLIATLLEDRRISSEEAERIQQLIARAERGK
ncbi:MAG TPA: BlaI/MecI/CopY family transcriptional regulator [Pirellulales bacterium]|jgi:predicted transcriptional regulator